MDILKRQTLNVATELGGSVVTSWGTLGTGEVTTMALLFSPHSVGLFLLPMMPTDGEYLEENGFTLGKPCAPQLLWVLVEWMGLLDEGSSSICWISILILNKSKAYLPIGSAEKSCLGFITS